MRALHAAQQRARLADGAADAIGLAVDVDRAVEHVAAHQDGGVGGEAPVCAVIGPRRLGHRQAVDAPAPEHAGLGVELVGALPDMGVFLRVASPVPQAFGLEHGGKPWIVGVVHLPQDRVRPRRPMAEHGIDRIGGVARVPGEPEFRTGLADRRHQDVERALRHGGGLLDPGNVDALHGLDRFRVRPQPGEEEERAVAPADAGGGRAVAGLQAQRRDPVVEQALGTVADGALDLAGRQDPQRPLGRHQDQRGRDRVGLSGAAPAEEGLVARRREQRPEGLRQGDVARRGRRAFA